MMQLWMEKHLESDITEKRLVDQRCFIIHNNVFTDVEMQHLETLARKKTTLKKQFQHLNKLNNQWKKPTYRMKILLCNNLKN
ncbi:hypothetical protein L345_15939 [Ophiophagus hannah]|uniref:Uncharacterized protein n=1 Tax=Ophiophagus hannah TaxID=8665 RepID=V8N9K5_OPHHA|nr:hypothetical protein L345_15939 [Ophiophagus hannah]